MVTFEEFHEFMSKFGWGKKVDDLREMFSNCDANGDGKIDLEGLFSLIWYIKLNIIDWDLIIEYVQIRLRDLAKEKADEEE